MRFSDFPASKERVVLSGILGRRRRILAYLVITIGLYTFFSPLISIDQSVLDKNQWSAWNIVWQVYEGNLPDKGVGRECERCGQRWVGVLWAVPKEYPIVYLLMPVALFAVGYYRSQRMLTILAGIGAAIAWEELKWNIAGQELGETFFGTPLAPPAHTAKLTLALLAVMGALLVIALNPDLDEML
jgi:hypothetical protein